MDTCTFPRYSENDIIALVRKYLLTGNEARNLLKSDLFPNTKSEVLHMIFMRVLQCVYGIRLEHFYMTPVTFDTAYPQLFEGFLPIGNLFFNMERFFPICRINDFQIADVINPKAKRTARFLSGIVNFLCFRESRLEIYLEIQNTYKSAMEKEQRLQVAIRDATLRLKKLDAVPLDQQAEFKNLSHDIQELQQKLNQEYRQKTSTLQEEIHQKRTQIAEKTQDQNELKLVICNLKIEQEQLKSKITESPEELTDFKERLKQTVQKIKKNKQEITKKYEAYRDLVETFPSCQRELQLYQKKMQTQGTNMDKLTNILSEFRTLEDQIENGKSGLKNAKTEEMSLKRLVTVKREKLTTIEIKLKKFLDDTEQRKETITEYCNTFQEKRGVVREKLTRTHAEIMGLKAAIQQLNYNVGKEKLKAQEIYINLRVGLEKYHENLARIVDTYTSAREDKTSVLSSLF